MTVALIAGWSGGVSALAGEEANRSRELQHQVFQDFKAGHRVYEKGEYAQGLERMESALATLQADETQRLDEFPETFSEKEARAFLMVSVMGGLHVWRKRLTGVYLDHGCFRQAKALAERDLFLFDKVPEDFGEAPMRLSDLYRGVLYSLKSAARGLGQLEEAIEVQTRIVDQDREVSRRPRVVAGALMGLASLYQEAADPESSQRLAAEARSIFDDVWRQEPPSERKRRSMEVWFLSSEGRHEEERRILEEDLAVILGRDNPGDMDLIWAYTELAQVYGQLGDDEKQRDVLDKALPLLLDPEPKASRYLPSKAYTAFYLLRKIGRAAEASRLDEKYRFCTE